MNLTVLIFLAGCICNAAAQSVPGPLIMSSGSPVLQSFGNANVLVISFPAPPPPTAPPFTLPPTFSGMTLESLPRISTRPPIISPAITASPALPDSALLRRDMPAYALVDLTKAQGFRMERKPVRPDQIGVLVGQQEAKDARFLRTASAEIKAAGDNVFALAINNGGAPRAQPQLVKDGERWVLKSIP